MSNPAQITTWLLVGALLGFPLAAAITAPAPDVYETRVVHDHDEAAAVTLAGKHGHDLVALDVREVWDSDLGNAMVFALTLDRGCDLLTFPPLGPECTDLTDTITFKKGSTEKTVTFVTDADQETWSGSLAEYSEPQTVAGTSFLIEGRASFSSLGVSPGDTLTDWLVVSSSGGTEADTMPAGPNGEETDPLGAAYDIGDYTVRAPDYYFSLDLAKSSVDLDDDPGDTETVDFTLTNLQDVEQTVDVTLSTSGSGVDAAFLDGGEEKQTLTFVLAPNTSEDGSTATGQVIVENTRAGVTRTVVVSGTSDLEGSAIDSLTVDVDDPPRSGGGGGGGGGGSGGGSTSSATDTSSATATDTATSSATMTDTAGAGGGGEAGGGEPVDGGTDLEEGGISVGALIGAIVFGLAAVGLLTWGTVWFVRARGVQGADAESEAEADGSAEGEDGDDGPMP